MPNWCQNEVTVSGDEKKVKEFIKFVSSKKSKFDFNKIYPMPKELEGTVSGSEDLKSDEQKANSRKWTVEFGADNWYRWSCDNWGTKWNACRTKIERVYDEEVTIVFETAWCTPSPIIKKLKETFQM